MDLRTQEAKDGRLPTPSRSARSEIGRDRPLALIAGPCVMEPGDMTLRIAAPAGRDLRATCGVPLIFKASFDKANRTSGSSFRGPGLDEGMKIFERVKAETGLPVTTDIHETDPGRGRSPRSSTCSRSPRSWPARPTCWRRRRRRGGR